MFCKEVINNGSTYEKYQMNQISNDLYVLKMDIRFIYFSVACLKAFVSYKVVNKIDI